MNPWIAGLCTGVGVQLGLLFVDQWLKAIAALAIGWRYGFDLSDEEFARLIYTSRLARISLAWQLIAWWPMTLLDLLRRRR